MSRKTMGASEGCTLGAGAVARRQRADCLPKAADLTELFHICLQFRLGVMNNPHVANDRAAAAPSLRRRIITAFRGLMIVAHLYAVGHFGYVMMANESGPPQQIYVFLIFVAGALLTLALSRRPAFSVGVPALAFIGIQQLSFAKFEYLLAPALIDDVFLMLKPEVGDLLLHGYPHLALVFFVVLGAAVAYLLAALALERPWSMRGRLGTPVAFFATALVMLGVVIPGPGPLAEATAETTEPSSANSDGDLLSRFFASVLHTGVKRPVFATPKVPWVPIGPAALPVAVGAGRPDIVVVLQETTFNPQTVLPFCMPAVCERPMLTGLPNSAAVGPMRVHVAGGLTWLTEFALFTGMPHSLFGQAGQYATAKILPRVKYTLPRWLKAQGYRTVVVYPVDKGTWGAAVAYPSYGFDEVMTHPLVASGQRDGYWDLTDRELFDVVQQRIAAEDRKNERAPLFIFVLTAQQHGPHGTHLKGQPHRDERPTFPLMSRDMNAKLNDYLTRLNWSDKAIRELDSSLAERARPYVLAHFGDHQPAFEGQWQGVPRRPQPAGIDPYYVTYFNIQTGGGLPRAGYRQSAHHPMLDIALLGGLILEVAGLPHDAYFAANARLRQRCDGLFLECADKDALAAYHQYIYDELGAVAF
jgi:hypothetical protein